MASAAGLYIHVPFCRRICPYCDFAVRTGSAARRAGFVAALRRELAAWRDWPHPIDTIYAGGGTPTALDDAQLAELVAAAREALPIAADARLFLEANPEDVTPERASRWAALGVDFLSLGAQSSDPEALRLLGRQHSKADVASAVEAARQAGVPRVSVDLIFGLPGQDLAALDRELDAALALAPDHLSAYQLTIEPGTRFAKLTAAGALAPLPDAGQAEAFARVHERCEGAGLPAYELSNFARGQAARSQHNRKYWDGQPYLGVGPSAHSYDGVAARWGNARGLPDWERALERGRPVAWREQLSSPQRALEGLLLGLRTREGLDLAALERRLGIPLLEPNAEPLRRFQAEGLLVVEGARCRATRAGWAVLDGIVRDLVIHDI